ncbi:MAG TPA: hypothetical protein VFB73_02760, partial [Chloroflexota bacterium]|nr:hypothetical protein [Chloroflexota bacterium]
PEAKAAVQEFFAAAERWQRAVRAGASPEEQEALRAAWQARRAPAEQAIAQTLAALAVREGLTASWLGKEILLPPVSFLLSEPPQVLVVSPRDRIEVVRSVLLRPDLSLAEVEALEREVDRLGVVSLVVPIGGFASYPAMVPLHATPRDTLNAIAHEWVHNLLVFYPLGRAYFASYDSRTLNETVAELAGRELGAMLAAAYGLPRRSSAAHEAAPAAGTFDFRQEMRATRLHLEQLLAAGQLEEAERYLEERRQAFVAAGYPLRKLNQAYFAFYGSYADSPAAVSPLDEQLRLLRAHSPSLGAFLRRVAQMTSSAEVEAALRALGAWPPAPEPNADLPSQQEVAAGGELVP